MATHARSDHRTKRASTPDICLVRWSRAICRDGNLRPLACRLCHPPTLRDTMTGLRPARLYLLWYQLGPSAATMNRHLASLSKVQAAHCDSYDRQASSRHSLTLGNGAEARGDKVQAVSGVPLLVRTPVVLRMRTLHHFCLVAGRHSDQRRPRPVFDFQNGGRGARDAVGCLRTVPPQGSFTCTVRALGTCLVD